MQPTPGLLTPAQLRMLQSQQNAGDSSQPGPAPPVTPIPGQQQLSMASLQTLQPNEMQTMLSQMESQMCAMLKQMPVANRQVMLDSNPQMKTIWEKMEGSKVSKEENVTKEPDESSPHQAKDEVFRNLMSSQGVNTLPEGFGVPPPPAPGPPMDALVLNLPNNDTESVTENSSTSATESNPLVADFDLRVEQLALVFLTLAGNNQMGGVDGVKKTLDFAMARNMLGEGFFSALVRPQEIEQMKEEIQFQVGTTKGKGKKGKKGQKGKNMNPNFLNPGVKGWDWANPESASQSIGKGGKTNGNNQAKKVLERHVHPDYPGLSYFHEPGSKDVESSLSRFILSTQDKGCSIIDKRPTLDQPEDWQDVGPHGWLKVTLSTPTILKEVLPKTIDSEKLVYYHNKKTGETRWDIPTEISDELEALEELDDFIIPDDEGPYSDEEHVGRSDSEGSEDVQGGRFKKQKSSYEDKDDDDELDDDINFDPSAYEQMENNVGDDDSDSDNDMNGISNQPAASSGGFSLDDVLGGTDTGLFKATDLKPTVPNLAASSSSSASSSAAVPKHLALKAKLGTKSRVRNDSDSEEDSDDGEMMRFKQFRELLLEFKVLENPNNKIEDQPTPKGAEPKSKPRGGLGLMAKYKKQPGPQETVTASESVPPSFSAWLPRLLNDPRFTAISQKERPALFTVLCGQLLKEKNDVETKAQQTKIEGFRDMLAASEKVSDLLEKMGVKATGISAASMPLIYRGVENEVGRDPRWKAILERPVRERLIREALEEKSLGVEERRRVARERFTDAVKTYVEKMLLNTTTGSKANKERLLPSYSEVSDELRDRDLTSRECDAIYHSVVDRKNAQLSTLKRKREAQDQVNDRLETDRKRRRRSELAVLLKTAFVEKLKHPWSLGYDLGQDSDETTDFSNEEYDARLAGRQAVSLALGEDRFQQTLRRLGFLDESQKISDLSGESRDSLDTQLITIFSQFKNELLIERQKLLFDLLRSRVPIAGRPDLVSNPHKVEKLIEEDLEFDLFRTMDYNNVIKPMILNDWRREVLTGEQFTGVKTGGDSAASNDSIDTHSGGAAAALTRFLLLSPIVSAESLSSLGRALKSEVEFARLCHRISKSAGPTWTALEFAADVREGIVRSDLERVLREKLKLADDAEQNMKTAKLNLPGFANEAEIRGKAREKKKGEVEGP